MSIEVTADESKAAKDFIESFTKKACDVVVTEVEKLPIKPASINCTKEEIKGECLHVAFAYLDNSGAPDYVSTTIAHLASEKVMGLDMMPFQIELQKVKEVKDTFDDWDDEEEEKKVEVEKEDIPEITIAYECDKIAMETVNAVHSICKEWNSKMPTLLKSKNNYEVYAHWEQNTRRKMEDKHIIVTQVNNLFGLDKDFPAQAYFGVFDGHGGVEAASYAIAHLHNNMAEQESFVSDFDGALIQSFKVTDKRFTRKARIEGLRAGTTGVVAFLRDNTLHIGWLGDSQVSMCKRGLAVKLMESHKPNRKDERKRIEELGGCVVWFGDWRVNGNIAVSRSIGDKDHKPFVSGDPDTKEYDLEGDEEYVILACDGLWDTIAPADVITIVQEHLAKGGARSEIAKLLVHSAKEHGSTDNITVVIIFLDCHRKQQNPSDVTEEASPASNEATVEESPSESSSQAHGTVANGVRSGTEVLSSVSKMNSDEMDTNS